MKCTSPFKVWLPRGTPITEWLPDETGVPKPYVSVRCGRCVACRVSRSQEWSIRLLHELSTTSGHAAVFLTLTYDDDHNPINLNKAHLTNFFKRLRKDLGIRKIKYYACGEYGELTFRCHFHAIIFGLSNNFEDRKLIKDNWTFGQIHIGTVTRHSCRYVADYCLKSLKNRRSFLDRGLQPPFCVMSKGLGKAYVAFHFHEFIKNRKIRIDKDHFIKLPRTYERWLGIKHGQIEMVNNIIEEHEKVGLNEILTLPEGDFREATKINISKLKEKKHSQYCRDNIK